MNEELRLREDWVECVIEDVGEVLTGGTPSKKRPEFYSQEDYPFYKPTDLNAGINVKESKDFLSALGYENSRKAIKNSILVTCIGATIGKTGLIKREGSFNQQINALLPNKGLSNVFLYYQIIGSVFQQQIKRNASSTTLPILNKSKFLKLKLNLPPYLIQKAIVKKIEALFSSLDSGIADLKKAQDQLVIYRQAVLKKAFEGELTKEWREKNDIKREKWNTNKLGEVLKTIDGDRGKNYPKKHELLNEGYCLFLSTKNVRQGEFVFKENLFITKEKDDLLRGGKLERNDVVLTTRGTLGNVALYDSKVNFNNIRINSGMLILRVNNQSELSQPFLMQFINSSLFFQQLKAKQSGTAQPQIPARVLREIEIEIPNEIKEQHQIVQEIESRLSVCDKVEKDIADSLEKAQALRQSILKKAFEGKLLSEEEIAKCKADKDYEPANVLLERIKAEKK